jgi:hypothetical protein
MVLPYTVSQERLQFSHSCVPPRGWAQSCTSSRCAGQALALSQCTTVSHSMSMGLTNTTQPGLQVRITWALSQAGLSVYSLPVPATASFSEHSLRLTSFIKPLSALNLA